MGEGIEYNGFSSLASICFQSYKSFSEGKSIEIPLHACLTLIIGRNNSGKSSIIDVIDEALIPDEKGQRVSGMHDIIQKWNNK